MRHNAKYRINARDRPHTLHRFFFRVENFASRLARTIMEVFAIAYVRSFENGMPIISSNRRPSSSFFAVVMMLICIPRMRSTLS